MEIKRDTTNTFKAPKPHKFLCQSKIKVAVKGNLRLLPDVVGQGDKCHGLVACATLLLVGQLLAGVHQLQVLFCHVALWKNDKYF